jgi:hypothetical protein
VPNPENIQPHKWKPGQSGNPAGYSRGRRVTDALIALIEDKGAEKPLASVWLRKALEGDPKFFAMLLDRVEGKPIEKPPEESDGTLTVNISGVDRSHNARADVAVGEGDRGGPAAP